MLTISIINCSILGITAAIVAFYTWETNKLRKTNQLEVRYNAIENRIKDLSESFPPQLGKKDPQELRNGSIKMLEEIIEQTSKTVNKSKDDSKITNYKKKLYIAKELFEYRKLREKMLDELRLSIKVN